LRAAAGGAQKYKNSEEIFSIFASEFRRGIINDIHLKEDRGQFTP